MSDPAAVSKQLLIMTRDHAEGDINYIYSTWLKSLYYGNGWAKSTAPISGAPVDIYSSMDAGIFFSNYNKVIQKILLKPNIKINISCLREDPDVILGFSISEPEILHFVFVKDRWRRLGIARDIIPEGIKFVTHLTRLGRGMKPKEWVFNPFLI